MRAEKVKVWQAIQPIHPADTVRGQYGPGIVDGKPVVGYRQEDRVHPRSQTETYAALRLEIENWRWAGVPFYIRAGKRLAKRVTEITIQFKQPPLLLFKGTRWQGAARHRAEHHLHAHPAGRGHRAALRREGAGAGHEHQPGQHGLQLRRGLWQVLGQRL